MQNFSRLFNFQTVSAPSSFQGLQTVLRPAARIEAESSLAGFVVQCRRASATGMAVMQNGRFAGVAEIKDVLPLLVLEDANDRERLLRSPVETISHVPGALATPDTSKEEAARMCARRGLSDLFVVDSDGRLLGVVSACDLLVPDLTPILPTTIGGMATPFGVYLTDGQSQAGVGTFALMTTGLLMGLLYAIATGVLTFGLGAVRHAFHLSDASWLNPDWQPPTGAVLPGLAIVGWSVIIFLLFMVLMRMTRLAGFHAAEHQTVHAIERREPLIAEVVCRMPRPHPRCGTNIMAGATILFTLQQAFSIFPKLSSDDALVIAAVCTLFTWRRVGTFLQARFTTRPASPRELASGIAAGNALLEQFANRPPTHPKLWRRVWCMGMIQVAAGMAVFLGLESFVWPHIVSLIHLR